MEIAKKLFTVEDYYRMAEVGILGPEDRVELIDGEILQMSPLGNKHIACSNRATMLFTEAFGRAVIVSVQNPLRLDTYNEPQPDIIILKPHPDFYESKRVSSEDALLVVEISDTSLVFDLKTKLAHYASSRVQEYWIEDLQHNLLLVFRGPAGSNYKESLTFRRGDRVSLLAFPDTTLKVEDLLG
jgi:Uma2 family endonuclease